MATQGSSKLVITGDGIPEVEKLWNGRYRLKFFCDPSNKTEGWYNGNIDKWLPDFGALQDHAIENGWTYPKNSDVAYGDMKLIEASVPFIPSAGVHYVKLTYETLTSSLVAEVDDKEVEGENGLKITERVLIAESGVDFGEVVGTNTYDGKTLIQSEVENTDAYTRVVARYSESGVISRSTDLVGGQQALVITSLGETPATPTGYSLAKTDVKNEGGFNTTSYTFLLGNTVMSKSQDYVGSQLAEMIEVFNPTTQPTPTNGSAVLGNKSESNVDGIPTTRYTFLVPSVLSESEDMVGSQKAITIEAFDEIPVTPTGYVIANEQESDVEGIPTKRYTFLKPSVLSETKDYVGSQLAISIEAFSEIPSTPVGYSLANERTSDFEGIPTRRYTFLKDDVQLSSSEDYVGSQLSVSQQWFNPSAEKTLAGYSLASKSVGDFEGIETVEYRFLKDDVELSRGEDKVGSQLAITTDVFNPTVDPTESGYSVARTEVSDVEGIPTKRFTFLKDNVQLSQSNDYVGSQLAVSQQWFNPSADKTLAGYSLANKNVGDFEGIPTTNFTFLKDGVTLSESTDLRNDGKLEIRTASVFNGSDPAPVGFTLISTRESDVEGIPTTTYTHAKGDGQVFVSESAGPNSIPGTTRKTVRAYGAELVPNGALIESQDIVRDGYTEYVRTTLDGTITGIKFQYPDVATVEVPGTVECTTQAVSEGTVSGTIAITNSTPRRQKQVATLVTVKIDTAMPTASPRAYDLGAISCSVTSVQTKLQSGDGSVATTGTTSQVGYQRNFASSASIQHYVGSYLTSASSTGSVDYQSSEQPYENGGSISVNTAYSYSTSTCTGTGATSAEGYATAGIIARDVDVILTALDGTVYYRIVTEETA